MIGTIGRGVLGLTVNCARCHNHKFDPISQKDYYQMQASLFGYVETDYPLAPKERGRGARPEERRNRREDRAAAAADPRARRALSRDSWRRRNTRSIRSTCSARSPFRKTQRTPGEALLAGQVIRTTSVSSAEIDRVMAPAELARKEALNAADPRAPEASGRSRCPMAAIVTDGDYRFAPDGPGDEPAPGKGVKQEAGEGSFLFKGPGRYQPPPSYFLIRGDVESRGLADEARLHRRDHVRQSAGRRSAGEWPHFGTAAGAGRVARVAGESADRAGDRQSHLEPPFRTRHRRDAGQLRQDGRDSRPIPNCSTGWRWSSWSRGWSIKQMHRLIMTSDAYQMASQFSDAAKRGEGSGEPVPVALPHAAARCGDRARRDDGGQRRAGPEDRRAAGVPADRAGDPGIDAGRHLEEGRGRPDGRGAAACMFIASAGWSFPMFEVFDLPDQNTSCGRRNVSTVPTQALTLLNNEFVLRQAKLFADRVEEAAPGDAAKQVELAYRIALVAAAARGRSGARPRSSCGSDRWPTSRMCC